MSSVRFSADSVLPRLPCAKLQLDNLFLQWLSMPECQKLVWSLLEDAKAGRPLQRAQTANVSSPTATVHQQLFPASNTPPLSPRKARSPRSFNSIFATPTQTHPTTREDTSKCDIPQFYFPGGKPVSDEVKRGVYQDLQAVMDKYPEGLSIAALKTLLKDVLELPSCLAYPLFYKLVRPGDTSVLHRALWEWLEAHHTVAASDVQRVFDILRDPSRNYVVYDDLRSMMNGILLSHPGLEFLQETPEFQERYAETVIYRIFYTLNRSGSSRLTLRELKRGDLLDALHQLDEEDDINRVLRYFSYEHFYVIYCKFWELDSDHDFLISPEDLLRYSNHSLTYRIVDRIFAQAARPFSCKTEGKMGYEDFVWFILSEEDKSTDVALEYWFGAVDLDSDSALRPYEMLYFYEEQQHRLESFLQEPVHFEDLLCQLHDMLQPGQEGCFTLRDLKRHRTLAGTLFNVLFNLSKFVAFEMADPFVKKQEREEPQLSDWDRFARTEYIRLAMEEEGEETSMDTQADMWDNSLSM